MFPALDRAMFPSLSDRTKSFIAVSAVLAVALCNVVFGMDWVAERPAARPLAAVTGVAEPPMLASPPVQSPPVPAAAVSPPLKGNTAAPARGVPRPNAAAQTNTPAAPKIGASQPDTAIIIMNEPAAPATAEALPKCDIAACAAAYRTFTASDCTYVPSFGVRKLCTKGTPPQ
jgi:BA14K-like protein